MMRVLQVRPRSVVIALSKHDADILLDLLVESQAEWENSIANCWIDPSDVPLWDDGSGERISKRLSEAIRFN